MATGEFLLYQTDDGRTRVECRFANESLWLTQAGMAELFATTPQNVTQHLRAIFAEGELSPEATCKEDLQVRVEGQRQVQCTVRYYRLEAILAVGYRVRSVRGTQFRRWATERLGEYLQKGFTLDDERLKNPPIAPPLWQAQPERRWVEGVRGVRTQRARRADAKVAKREGSPSSCFATFAFYFATFASKKLLLIRKNVEQARSELAPETG